ncbi:hypothetical protein FACS189443_2670 [Planctomycetales bacterium]|nr:hypothetical protein FACS189443_2670 [Planctomycetales bacterium]
MQTAEQFLETLRRSGLVDLAKLDEAVADIENEATLEQFHDASYVASQLISRFLITIWQSKQLLKGRYKGFFLRQYKILGHLGSGGMSAVYLAEHIMMQRQVAIKVLPRKRLEKAIYLERFIREAQAIASLDHQNIIRAYDFDHDGDLHYIIMEYFPGDNLQTIIDRDKKIPFPRIANILRQTADALGHAHEIGVIHRDVKPSNILVNHQGEVRVLDLGLALLDEHVYEGRITHIQEDTILGTADYLAPEQALDSHKVDARADIYALGCVLYFCLTGHPPFPEGSVSKRLLDHQQNEPSDIFADRPDAPTDLVQLCKKMMSKNPNDRQQTAKVVARDFENWLTINGYADPTDFVVQNPLATKIPLRINLGETKQLPDQNETGGLSKSGEAAEDNINLFGGGSQISGVVSLTSVSSAGRDDSQVGDYNDALFAKLNQIEQERVERRRRESKKNETQTIIDLKPKNKPGDASIAWYRGIPVWFWTLFFAGYIAAFFLAGIVATLIAIFLGTSGTPPPK